VVAAGDRRPRRSRSFPDPFSAPGRGRPIWRWEARSQRRTLPSSAEVARVLPAGWKVTEPTKLG
jgi:hypothetical protein